MSVLFESFWFDTVLVAVTLLSILYYLWTLNYNYWKDRNVPYLEPSFPFGNTKDFLLSKRFSGYVFKDLYFQLKGHKYGGIINMRRPQLLLRDPEIIKLILTKDFKYFTDRGTSIDEKVEPLLAHLFHLTGERWRSLRIQLTPTFTSGKMKMMFHLMKTCANLLDESLEGYAEKEEVIDLKNFMARYGIDVVGACAFGLETDSLKNPNNEFFRIGKEIFKSRWSVTIRNMLNSIIPDFANTFKIKITPKEREDFFIKIVGDSVKYREANNIVRNDFLDLIIQIRNKGKLDDELSSKSETSVSSSNGNGLNMKSSNNVYLTDEQMTAQCFVFFVAGFETSSTTLSFCLYELSKHKLVLNKLQEEIDNVLTKYNYEITYEALKEMTYMDLVVQETLRKYSPVPALSRTCVADYTLKEGNLKIEKGTPIVIPVYGLHYDPEYYPEPEHFDPERFTAEAKQSRPNYTWLPFGEGPRNCIGMRFGLMQVKTGLTTLLSRYNFDCVPETPIPMELSSSSILTAPSKEIKLKISKRTK